MHTSTQVSTASDSEDSEFETASEAESVDGDNDTPRAMPSQHCDWRVLPDVVLTPTVMKLSRLSRNVVHACVLGVPMFP